MSLEDVIIGEVEETELPEKMKREIREREYRWADQAVLFECIDSILKKVGDAVSFSLKEGINPRDEDTASSVRGGLRWNLSNRGRRGEWETFWDAEAKKMYVEKVK